MSRGLGDVYKRQVQRGRLGEARARTTTTDASFARSVGAWHGRALQDIDLALKSTSWKMDMAFDSWLQTVPIGVAMSKRPLSATGAQARPAATRTTDLSTALFARFPVDDDVQREAARRVQPVRPTLLDALEVEVRQKFRAAITAAPGA